jgi:hypothetical protein
MTATLTAAPTQTSAVTGAGDDLNHIYCCNPSLALCGTDISGSAETDFDVASCVVCADLEANYQPSGWCWPNCDQN